MSTNPHVILFVDPDDESFLVIVEDASRVRPISCHAGRRQQRRNGLIEQIMLVDKLLLEFFGHFWHLEVSATELAVKFSVVQSARDDFFDFAALGARAHRRQR